MRWLVLFLLASWPAWAQPLLLRTNGPHPIVVWDFRQMNALPAGATFTRASSLNDWSCASGSPVLVTFATNVPALGVCNPATGNPLGIGLWSSSVAQNQYARNLTQTYWTKTNMTAALTAVGIDGTASSASLLTATAGNATVCSNLVGAAAQQRVLSLYVKRVTGTGEIDVSQDCATWTKVDGQINSAAYVRVPGGGHYATVQNSVIGIRIVTSGDAIDVDYANVEADNNNNHWAPTPPILTTSSGNITRSADALSIPLADIPGFTPDRFTIVAQFYMPVWGGANSAGSGSRSPGQFDDGSNANAVFLRVQSQQYGGAGIDNDMNVSTEVASGTPAGKGKTRCSAVPPNQLVYLVAPYPSAFTTIVASYDVNSGMSLSCNNGAGLGSQPVTVATPGGLTAGQLTRLTLAPTLVNPLNGYLMRIILFNGRLQGQALTALAARYSLSAPVRHIGFFPLNDGSGGRLTWETGAPMQCNNC